MEMKEVVRIKVKMCNGLVQPQYKKLCIDPQITSFAVLHSLLARAFNINSQFAISYLSSCGERAGVLGRGGGLGGRVGGEQGVYVSLLSDWDLDAAILDSSAPYLCLKVDLRPFDEGLADWDLVSSPPTPVGADASRLAAVQSSLLDTFSKTVSSVSKAIGLKSQSSPPSPPRGLIDSPCPPMPSQAPAPLTDADFRSFLDPVGELVEPTRFRLAVYARGVEPGLRKVVWRHLLNVYPEGLNGRERFDYLRGKRAEYLRLKEAWGACLREGGAAGRGAGEQGKGGGEQGSAGGGGGKQGSGGGVQGSTGESEGVNRMQLTQRWSRDEVERVKALVRKDVLRTDRTYSYYAGADDSTNVQSLSNVLVTYALTHPSTSYCQGMSDLAAPLLVVEKDEGGAYVCFASLMRRLTAQFSAEGQGLSCSLRHLALLLERADPPFHAYLTLHGADDLFFTYRWLLLLTKREFPLDDAMYALEVMWATLPADPPPRDTGLCLVEEEGLVLAGGGALGAEVTNREESCIGFVGRITKSSELGLVDGEREEKLGASIGAMTDIVGGSQVLDSLASKPDRSGKTDLVSTAIRLANFPLEDSTRQSVVGSALSPALTYGSDSQCAVLSPASSPLDGKPSHISSTSQSAISCIASVSGSNSIKDMNSRSITSDVIASDTTSVTRSARHRSPEAPPPQQAPKPPQADEPSELASLLDPAVNSNSDYVRVPRPPRLPPPGEFGEGNPFLLFLCLAMLLQQRDVIMAREMDYNDLAMHYDRQARRNDVQSVVQSARTHYAAYLRDSLPSGGRDTEDENDPSV